MQKLQTDLRAIGPGAKQMGIKRKKAVWFWTLPGKMRSQANFALKAPHKAGRNTLARGAALDVLWHGTAYRFLIWCMPTRRFTLSIFKFLIKGGG